MKTTDPASAWPFSTKEKATYSEALEVIKNSEAILGKAIKADAGKPPMSLLSNTALVEIAKVLEFGKNKYSAHNWRSGFAYSRVLDAAARHLYAYIDGEDCDPESGLSHLAHLGCCVMFMLELEKTHPELDDRYKRASS